MFEPGELLTTARLLSGSVPSPPDWVIELNTDGPEALVDYKGPGPQPILTDVHRTALAQALRF